VKPIFSYELKTFKDLKTKSVSTNSLEFDEDVIDQAGRMQVQGPLRKVYRKLGDAPLKMIVASQPCTNLILPPRGWVLPLTVRSDVGKTAARRLRQLTTI
jgi:hypothetical protein